MTEHPPEHRPISGDDLVRCHEALRLATDHGAWDQAITSQVRALVGRELAAVVLATAALQTKAVAKFGEGLWWASERSLQQATAGAVARLKASWVRGRDVIDLCCGIGADTFALAHATSGVASVDRDEAMVAMASENLRINGHDPATVQWKVADVSEIVIPGDAIVHIDPDRREGENRASRPENYSPDWETTQRLVESALGGIVKLAPAADLDDRSDRHRIWISLKGSVREQTLLTGEAMASAAEAMGIDLAGAGRTAIAIRDSVPAVFAPSRVEFRCGETDKPESFMVDPDAAIRGAGLTESFALHHELKTLGAASGFLTGATAVNHGAATCERVVWSGACDDRKLRKTLRKMDCYPIRVKTRGVSQNPNVLEKKYRECGEKPVTLWIGKSGKRQFAALTEPMLTEPMLTEPTTTAPAR